VIVTPVQKLFKIPQLVFDAGVPDTGKTSAMLGPELRIHERS
jgi:hypothetical protein